MEMTLRRLLSATLMLGITAGSIGTVSAKQSVKQGKQSAVATPNIDSKLEQTLDWWISFNNSNDSETAKASSEELLKAIESGTSTESINKARKAVAANVQLFRSRIAALDRDLDWYQRHFEDGLINNNVYCDKVQAWSFYYVAIEYHPDAACSDDAEEFAEHFKDMTRSAAIQALQKLNSSDVPSVFQPLKRYADDLKPIMPVIEYKCRLLEEITEKLLNINEFSLSEKVKDIFINTTASTNWVDKKVMGRVVARLEADISMENDRQILITASAALNELKSVADLYAQTLEAIAAIKTALQDRVNQLP